MAESKNEPEDTSDAPPHGESTHRFKFGERWARKRQQRSLSRAWSLLALDLALLLIIVALTTYLVKQL